MDEGNCWREMAASVAELAYETDAAGHFVWVAPDPALGWSAATLQGQPAHLLLAPAPAAGFDPFLAIDPMHRRRVWLRRRSGSAACVEITVRPVLDADGRVRGTRGLAIAAEATEGASVAIGASQGALRRAEVLDRLLARMREHVLATEMLNGMLDLLCGVTGAEGAAILDTLREAETGPVLHQVGGGEREIQATALAVLTDAADQPMAQIAPDRRPVLGCPSYTRFGERVGLVLWRAPGGAPWDADDLQLGSSAAALVRVVLEHGAIQRHMALQARTDLLTGLLCRRTFIEDATKRIERLEREELPATLLLLDLDGFKAVNECCGIAIGDRVLGEVAALLRNTVRPTDLVARLHGDKFALWLDGADSFTGAERAEALRLHLPERSAAMLPDPMLRLTVSIGLAARRPGAGEEVEGLLRRAALALQEVKRQGRAHWRVSHDEPL